MSIGRYLGGNTMFKKLMVAAMLIMSLTLVFNTGCSKKGTTKTVKAASGSK